MVLDGKDFQNDSDSDCSSDGAVFSAGTLCQMTIIYFVSKK